jgi:hypothetical protein
MHMQTASQRRDELEIKVLAADKSKRLKNKKQSASKRPIRTKILSFLSDLVQYPFCWHGSSTVAQYDRYSRFGRADQLWEEEDEEDEQEHHEGSGGDSRC